MRRRIRDDQKNITHSGSVEIQRYYYGKKFFSTARIKRGRTPWYVLSYKKTHSLEGFNLGQKSFVIMWLMYKQLTSGVSAHEIFIGPINFEPHTNM